MAKKPDLPSAGDAKPPAHSQAEDHAKEEPDASPESEAKPRATATTQNPTRLETVDAPLRIDHEFTKYGDLLLRVGGGGGDFEGEPVSVFKVSSQVLAGRLAVLGQAGSLR
jgi:hypothetical protein